MAARNLFFRSSLSPLTRHRLPSSDRSSTCRTIFAKRPVLPRFRWIRFSKAFQTLSPPCPKIKRKVSDSDIEWLSHTHTRTHSYRTGSLHSTLLYRFPHAIREMLLAATEARLKVLHSTLLVPRSFFCDR